MSPAEKAGGPAKTKDSGLHVVVECGGSVVAVPAASVLRLLLAEDVAVLPPKAAVDGGRNVATATVDGKTCAAFDLAPLLGLSASAPQAWVLCTCTRGGRSATIALGTGPCLVVGEVPQTSALAPGAFRQRRGALRAAFSTSTLAARGRKAPIGLVLSLDHLLDADEMASALWAMSKPEAKA